MLALILAAAIDVQQVCAKYRGDSPVPPAAAECDGDSLCSRELAQQFANADEPDFELAEYFLCVAEAGMAEAEFEGMWEHLQRMRGGEEDAPLDFCDHATSGYGSSYCANVEYEELMPRLDARLDALHVPDALRTRGDAFVRAESERIGDESRGGTGYAAIALGAEMEAKQHFVESVERWSRERAPAASAAAAKRADEELNAAYRAIEERTTFLRDAQRAWIAYRDAFATYYVTRWKGTASEDALRREIVTQLTRDRTSALRRH